MKKKDKLIVSLSVIIVILVVIILVLLIKKGLPINSKNSIVTNAYQYVSNKDLEKCNGLVMYSKDKVTKDTLDNTTKICLSYALLDVKGEEVKLDKNKKSNTCTLKDDSVFAIDNYEGDICTVSKISKDEVHKQYKKLFGEKLKTDESFKLDNVSICYFSDDSYYCGLSEKYTYILGAEPHTYRTIKNSYKKNDKLIIYDYFVRVINDECYESFMTNDKNDKCTKQYDSKKDIDYNFMKKYGTVYKHTFQKDGDSYYWVSSEQN